jgi:hypothetical protein
MFLGPGGSRWFAKDDGPLCPSSMVNVALSATVTLPWRDCASVCVQYEPHISSLVRIRTRTTG